MRTGESEGENKTLKQLRGQGHTRQHNLRFVCSCVNRTLVVSQQYNKNHGWRHHHIFSHYIHL